MNQSSSNLVADTQPDSNPSIGLNPHRVGSDNGGDSSRASHVISSPPLSSSSSSHLQRATANDVAPLASPSPETETSRVEPHTLVEMFDRIVRAHRKPNLLNYKAAGEWHALSSDEVLRQAEQVALGLYALGVRKGERIAILSENRPEWTITDAGALLCGAIDVPVYTTQTPAQVCYILNDSKAQVLFVQNRAQFERVRDAIKSCRELKHVVFFEADGAGEHAALTFAELQARGSALADAEPQLLDELKRATVPKDLATIIYTSGTTGDPKGVMLSHANLISNLIESAHHLLFHRTDRVLSVLPLSHIFERTAMYMHLYHGIAVFYAESLDAIADNLREAKPTILIAVPRLFEKMYSRIKDKAAQGGQVKLSLLMWAIEVGKQAARLEFDAKPLPPLLALQYRVAKRLVFSKWQEGFGGAMRFFISGGAALPEELALVFAGAGMPILQGYGLTETSPVITSNSLEYNRPGTVGKTVRGVEVRVAEDGEIETRGPNVMQGYYNKPEATAEVFTADGWFKTGDIGEIDADGYLKITDRKKELFKTSGGKYIAPQPIETAIKRSRFVSQVVLIGNNRKFPAALIVPDWEQVKAASELKDLAGLTPSELCTNQRLIDFFMNQINANCEHLAQFEKVKRIALLEKELTIASGELTPTMKVKRRIIDENYRAAIEQIYAE